MCISIFPTLPTFIDERNLSGQETLWYVQAFAFLILIILSFLRFMLVFQLCVVIYKNKCVIVEIILQASKSSKSQVYGTESKAIL